MEKSIHTRDYGVFCKLLRRVRENADVTQVQLAKKLKSTQSFVSKVELGDVRLDIIQLREILGALGIPLGDFIAELDKELNRRS
jgi:transcriptional regulator with XRE-family HTH domain